MPFGDLNMEAIAALRPDLIMAQTAGITAEEYALLAKIARPSPRAAPIPTSACPGRR